MEVVMAKPIVSKHLLVTAIFVFYSISICVSVEPEQGIFEKTTSITEGLTYYYEGFTKSMYNDSSVSLMVEECKGGPYSISWMIRFSECEGIYQILDQNGTENSLSMIFEEPTSMFEGETFIEYYKGKEQKVDCDEPFSRFQDDSYVKWTTYEVPPKATPAPAQTDQGKSDGSKDKGDAKNKAKRETKKEDTQNPDALTKNTDKGAENKGTDKSGGSGKQDNTGGKEIKEDTGGKNGDSKTAKVSTNTEKEKGTKKKDGTEGNSTLTYRVTKTKRDGRYLFIVKIEPIGGASGKEKENQFFSRPQTLTNHQMSVRDKPIRLLYISGLVIGMVSIKVEMKSPKGYLSAFQWPLLPFYGVMCAIYSILAFVWLLLLGCNWRDLLRIQFWICGVIVLGLLEKAIFYAEYEHLNKEGYSVTGAIIFAELMSCLKRSLARMLLIIVSLGYGITRPRLGKDLHWVMAAGATYFILSSVEGCLRVKGNEQHALIAVLPLAVLDAVICWWIFKNLVDTTRQLRLRRNLTKLWLYRHLTNALIVCIVCAVVFLVWSTKAHRWTTCVTKWRELWLDDAYWHVLFCIILVVIMVLIRPTANNQRYAFSPLVDAVDDEESQQPMINDAFDSVKMRQMPGEKTSSGKSPADDALKWVEDNIPAAVADAALGAFDDSEEELVNTLERNKME